MTPVVYFKIHIIWIYKKKAAQQNFRCCGAGQIHTAESFGKSYKKAIMSSRAAKTKSNTPKIEYTFLRFWGVK